MYSLFIFFFYLRLEDNTGLLAALKESKAVIPCFIFDPKQVEKNTYKSEKRISFVTFLYASKEKLILQTQTFLH